MATLNDFDVNKHLTRPSSVLLVGTSGVHRCCASMAKKVDISRWIVWCSTQARVNFWTAAFGSDDLTIHLTDHAGLRCLEQVVSERAKVRRELGIAPLGFIFDISERDHKFMRDRGTNDVVANNRAYHITVFYVYGGLRAFNLGVWSNSDFVVVTKSDEDYEQSLFKRFVDSRWEQFREALATSTEDSSYALVYNRIDHPRPPFSAYKYIL
jgi:hypothetical protein